MRCALAWLLAVPLIAVGSQAAHALDYQLVLPGARRAEELEASGHGYLSIAPQFLALCGTLVLVALVLCVTGRRTSRATGVPPWLFAFLPPLTFVLQEHLERLLHDGVVPWGAALDPTFLPGVLLQFPFALLAYALARLVVGAAGALRRLIERAPRAWVTDSTSSHPRPREIFSIARPPIACGRSLRGPPAPALT